MHKRVIRLSDGNIVRDDFKGSYDEVDEFSLKIINAGKDQKLEAKAKEKIIVTSEPEAEAVSNTSEVATDTTDVAEIQKEPEVVEKPKLKQSKKKISFSTKKSK
jgi:hypothetical protein